MKAKGFFSEFKSDFPASIVVFFVALPLCLGIALASGAPLFSGLIAGIVGGVVVAETAGVGLTARHASWQNPHSRQIRLNSPNVGFDVRGKRRRANDRNRPRRRVGSRETRPRGRPRKAGRAEGRRTSASVFSRVNGLQGQEHHFAHCPSVGTVTKVLVAAW